MLGGLLSRQELSQPQSLFNFRELPGGRADLAFSNSLTSTSCGNAPSPITRACYVPCAWYRRCKELEKLV